MRTDFENIPTETYVAVMFKGLANTEYEAILWVYKDKNRYSSFCHGKLSSGYLDEDKESNLLIGWSELTIKKSPSTESKKGDKVVFCIPKDVEVNQSDMEYWKNYFSRNPIGIIKEILYSDGKPFNLILEENSVKWNPKFFKKVE